jgi:hypothetical protein
MLSKRFGVVFLALLVASSFLQFVKSGWGQDWRTASRASIGTAPDPASTPEAVIQVYGARTVAWRGWFGVHTWIAAKRTNEQAYTVYEVIGWRLYRGGSAVSVSERIPDARWFGAAPELFRDLRGAGVDQVIDRIAAAAQSYPYPDEYTLWPGPNSNTFVAWIGRQVPELQLDLPATAIGKDYLGPRLIAQAPSGTGYQFSLFGLFGLTVAKEEGLEVNILGLTFGVDPLNPAIKLPMVGRLGMDIKARRAMPAEQQAQAPL